MITYVMTTPEALPISGVYKIVCTTTGKVYIGSSNNFRLRCRQHRKDLRSHTHSNIHLQRAWDMYGEGSFEIALIEECSIPMLNEREQYWIVNLRACEDGFNIALFAGSPMRGRSWSDESKSKASQSHIGKSFSEEHRANIGKALKGREFSAHTRALIAESRRGHPLTAETKAKMSARTKGVKKPPEHGLHVSQALKGIEFTEEHCRHISENHKSKKEK